jgi:hypothetical protein
MATGCKPLLDPDRPTITRLKTPTDSLNASGRSVFPVMISPANEFARARQPAWLVMRFQVRV